MFIVRASLRAMGAAVAATALTASVTPSALAVDDVPILGQAFTVGISTSDVPGVVTVHGVRRVEGATIVYWSIGAPPGTTEMASPMLGTLATTFYELTGPKANDVAVMDLKGLQLYRPLQAIGSGYECVCSPVPQQRGLVEPLDGQAFVMWSSVSELPPDVTTVAVKIAEQTIINVPVEEGPMLPLAENQAAPIVLGMGWPDIDQELVAKGSPQDPASLPLVGRVSDLQREVTTSKGEVSLDSDVLFAKGSSDLTQQGSANVAASAARIKSAAAVTTLTVTGHADSDGADAYNLTLSEQRAKTVAAALTKALGDGYTITALGKGETEPIASNSTDVGKAKNRRVSITFTEGP